MMKGEISSPFAPTCPYRLGESYLALKLEINFAAMDGQVLTSAPAQGAQ